MFKTVLLLPRNFRFVGIGFFIAGCLATFIRFYLGVKPKLLNLKVFAVHSEYLNNSYLKVVNNNFGEEIAIILIITGLFLFAFSREKSESEMLNVLRLKAFFISFYLSFAFLLAATFFTFGFAFIYMLILNMAVPLILYITTFKILLLRKGKPVIETGNKNSVLNG